MTMLTRTLTILLISVFLLSGCGQPPVRVGGPRIDVKPTITDPAETAKRLEKQGKYQQAAQEYLKIAAQSTPPTRQGHQLSAIKAYFKGGMLDEARTELAKLDTGQSYGLEIPLEFMRIKIDLAEQHASSALKRLKGIEPSTLPSPLQLEYKQLHAQATAAKGEVIQAVREWMAIDNSANADPTVIKENHQQLWRSLSTLERSALEQVPQKQGDMLSGWTALALLTKTSPQKHLAAGINNWQLRFPNHPATQHIVPTLVPKLDQLPSPPKQVALLLAPVKSKFGKQAEAVQNGFFAALEADFEGKRPNIATYEVNADDVLEVYQNAVAGGADFVVGPLLKNTLSVLADSHVQLPVPTLGLNHLGTPVVTGNLYQFALSPEDEAKEVAKRAWADGHRSALILVPEGNWGKRVSMAFKTEWEKQGGQVVTQSPYGSNFKSSIPRILRKKSAKAADMAFVVAFPKIARQIIPLFKSRRSDLPIYSTSHVYRGTPNPSYDRKINGVVFVDTPWVLAPDENGALMQTTLQQSSPKGMRKYKRLYALGIDAYYSIPQLQRLSQSQWQGQTGRLFVDSSGIIHRDQLRFARFAKGKPQLLE